MVVAGSVLASCGGDDGDGRTNRGGGGTSGGGASGGGTGADQPLEGTQWILDQKATKLTVAIPSAVVTAQFSSDGSLTGNSGCNQYNTTYTTSGSKMTVNGPIASTRKACTAAISRLEAAYGSRLVAAQSYGIAGSVLTIRTSDGGPLVYDALDPELQGPAAQLIEQLRQRLEVVF